MLFAHIFAKPRRKTHPAQVNSTCGSSLLLDSFRRAWGVYLGVLLFSNLHKNQHLHIPIRPGLDRRPTYQDWIEDLHESQLRLMLLPF